MEEFQNKLIIKLNVAKKIVFLGVGEEKLSDDAVGLYIISELLNYSSEKFLFINGGIDPMSRVEDVLNFKTSCLVIIDTCTLDKPPGTVAIIERENIKNYVPISSHTIPIHIFIDLLIEKLPNLNVFMIGIVPESLNGFTELKLYKENVYSLEERSMNEDLPFFEFNLTEKIQKVANKIIKIIKNLITTL